MGAQGLERHLRVHQGRTHQERPHAQQKRQGGLEEAVQARTEASEEGWRMDDGRYEGPQRARHHRLLPDEQRNSRSRSVQEGQGALLLNWLQLPEIWALKLV